MKRLLEPFHINQMGLKNRLVMAPMATLYGGERGYVTERIKDYYEARALGGVGLIIVEFTYVHPRGQVWPNQMGISDDTFIPGMSELVQVIHRHGAKAALQMHHGGREAKSVLMQMQPVAPSPLARLHAEVPKELTLDEIAKIVVYFAEASYRVKKAGFDAVEIHGAHGYLIDNFLSRSSNKRKDKFGGALPNRARFLTEVIKATREAVGKDFPVWCRINAKEYGLEEATTLEEGQQVARMAQEAGADAIHVSAWGPTSPTLLTSPRFVAGVIEELAEGIKKAVTVPVIAVGRITPEAGERILAEGKADLVAIAKGLLADPELPNKVLSGRLEDITPCIVCMGCRDDIYDPTVGIRCSVNAALGKERESDILLAKKRKRVLVIGGGPAGMEAARVAALRGHQVTLWEKASRLGGQLVQAAIPPYKDRVGRLTEYLETQLKKLNVKIELHKEATAAMVEEFAPEAVVVAAGGKPVIPEIPGLEDANVVQAGEVLEDKVQVGNKVIIIGGESVGCETAEFLADKGKSVIVMRRGSQMALSAGYSLRAALIDRLLKKNVTLLTDITYNEVTPNGLVVTNKKGERKAIKVDTIVLAAGSVPDKELCRAIETMVPEVYIIGDCIQPRTIRDAIADGYSVGLRM